MHRLRNLLKLYPVECYLVCWLVLVFSVVFVACYTGNPPTVCNPANVGCTRPFGTLVDGGPG